MIEKKISVGDMIVVGFTMFAVFFGAGNLIFPPYLGMMAGSEWFKGFLCFIIADAGLAIATVLIMMRGDGTIMSFLGRLGRKTAYLISFIAMVCVGPLICIPRTAATTYEMGALPLFPWLNSWVFSVIFFGVVYLLTVRPSKVVDIIGKFLTPMMLVTLAVLFIKGIITPIGDIRATAIVENVAKEGFMSGYQTMDVLGAVAITLVLAGNVAQRGYKSHSSKFKVMAGAGIVATVGLFLVYCGLAYLGATASMLDLGDINQTGLVVLVTELLLKKFGVVLLALIVTFACMTTAIGLVSSAAEFFSDCTRGRISYGSFVILMCIAGAVMSNVGITAIINMAAPVLNIIYPVLLSQLALTLFDKHIKKDNVFRGSAVFTLITCILRVACDYGAPFDFIRTLPLAAMGFEWILPAVVGGIVGSFIPDVKPAKMIPSTEQ